MELSWRSRENRLQYKYKSYYSLEYEMKQKITDENKARYNAQVNRLSNDIPREKRLLQALTTLSLALKKAEKEDHFPLDINLIVQHASDISNKDTTLEEKGKALQTLLTIDAPSTLDAVVDAVCDATKAVACLAWGAACMGALAAYYAFTFPYGMVADVAVGLAVNDAPPLGKLMYSLAVAPAEIAFPRDELNLSEKKESTAQTELREAIQELRNTVDTEEASSDKAHTAKVDDLPRFQN